MRQFVILVLVIFCYSPVSFSEVLRGSVVDVAGLPIPYSSIGIPESSVGTVSNEQGQFALDISALPDTHYLIVSCIGYSEKRFS